MSTCRTCQHWHADEEDLNQSVRGYCGNPRSEKAGNRTKFEDSCRHWSQRQEQETPSFQKGDNVEFLWVPGEPEAEENPWMPGSIEHLWADGKTITIVRSNPTRYFDRPIQ